MRPEGAQKLELLSEGKGRSDVQFLALVASSSPSFEAHPTAAEALLGECRRRLRVAAEVVPDHFCYLVLRDQDEPEPEQVSRRLIDVKHCHHTVNSPPAKREQDLARF